MRGEKKKVSVEDMSKMKEKLKEKERKQCWRKRKK